MVFRLKLTEKEEVKCQLTTFLVISARNNSIRAIPKAGRHVVEWLKHRADDQQGLGSKSICAILLCSWERHFMALSPAWWSWQVVPNYSNISTKLPADRNILASPEAGRGNCLPYV